MVIYGMTCDAPVGRSERTGQRDVAHWSVLGILRASFQRHLLEIGGKALQKKRGTVSLTYGRRDRRARRCFPG